MSHAWSIAALVAVILFALLVNSYLGVSKFFATSTTTAAA